MRKSSHSVTDLNYHIVIVTKKRKRLLTGDIEETIKEECRRIIEHFEGEMTGIETDADHIHLLVNLSPKYSISQIVNVLKGVSARIARRDHGEEITKVLKGSSFWSPSYFAATTGGVTLEMVKKYIESQKSEEHQKKRKDRSLTSPPKVPKE